MSESCPLIMPDYLSEENWNVFLGFLPSSESTGAPTYSESSKNTQEAAKEQRERGIDVVLVKVEAFEWKKWVEKHNLSLTRSNIGPYASHKYAEETTGKAHVFIDGRSIPDPKSAPGLN